MTIEVTPQRRASKRRTANRNDDIQRHLASRIVGQDDAIGAIVPFIQIHRAGLAPEGRPAGVFLLLGPTGTGKTRTVEALAEALHGDERGLLKINCGEFQMEHEVAKLIGAPPGYLGHRETHPILTQARLAAVTSERCALSIVLFDEIEKAAPSMCQLLLGILDKATLRLGDNTVVNFENALIFMTSNLGAKGISKALKPGLGLGASLASPPPCRKLEQIAVAAVKRHFSPEFINRIDTTLTYKPLTEESIAEILGIQLYELQRLIIHRLGARAFRLTASRESREFLVSAGTTAEYGARELKRAIHQHLVQPVARLVAEGSVPPGGEVIAELSEDGRGLSFRVLPYMDDPAVAA